MATTQTTEATVDTNLARREYAARRRHASYDNTDAATFDAACRAILGEGTFSPAQWLAAADRVRFTCRRCAGTGMFVTGTLNGQPTGPGGDCFRCEGRGTQGWKDGRRNAYHDSHYMARGY